MTTMFPREGVFCEGPLVLGGRKRDGHAHFYCAACHGFVYSQIGAGERINLRTSVLDAAAAFPPFVELMTDEKLPWAKLSVDHSFAHYPASVEELQALMAAYAQSRPAISAMASPASPPTA